jgi:hypothetical protein
VNMLFLEMSMKNCESEDGGMYVKIWSTSVVMGSPSPFINRRRCGAGTSKGPDSDATKNMGPPNPGQRRPRSHDYR